jgi:hypothetical protein
VTKGQTLNSQEWLAPDMSLKSIAELSDLSPQDRRRPWRERSIKVFLHWQASVALLGRPQSGCLKNISLQKNILTTIIPPFYNGD